VLRPIAKRENSRGQISMFDDIDLSPATFCGGCSRLITSEKSVERGFGPSCWIAHLEQMLRNESETTTPPITPAKRRKRKGISHDP